jgi:ribose/xylose/arabinose/galactoside ABC-type transport system permease subunit
MRLPLARKNVPVAATTLVCVLLYVVACLRYDHFFSWPVFINFFGDNAVLGLAAIGVTFVILGGGIDLSMGAIIGCTSITVAKLITAGHVHPLIAIGLVLALGAAFGAGMGSVIHFFRLPPFLVTLAGMFLARGTGLVISQESVDIRHPLYTAVSDFSALNIPGTDLPMLPATALIFLGVLLIAMYAAGYTRFGRNVYALGGSEPSALLMGLPVGRTKIATYSISAFCSALAGVVHTLYTSSGSAAEAGKMLELDAIAAVVIGGTLLTGGVGYVFGTLIGVLICGIIQTAIMFEGTLNSWWTRIAIGALLLAFILLQKLVQARAAGRT